MLNAEDQEFAYKWLLTKCELPVYITDPLEAFKWGIGQAVRHIGLGVSKDSQHINEALLASSNYHKN